MEQDPHPPAAAHLAGCPQCRALVADLEAIRSAAAALPEVEPPARVWTALRSQLERENLVRSGRSSWRDFFRPALWLRPSLAGAYLALIIGISVSLVWQGKTSQGIDSAALWMRHAQKSMATLQSELNNASTNSIPAAAIPVSDVTATLNRNLAIVDNMISLCEKSVREDPQNEMTRDYMYAAYQQKANLLAAIADSGAEGR